MITPTTELFFEMIEGAEKEIASIDSQIESEADPKQLHALRSIQEMYRANIKRLRSAIAYCA
jgi:Mg2+ and Co2+ transporter CorA